MSDRYGIVYMGSKEKILHLIQYIFEREYQKKYFVDMFAGGFSVSGYALAKTHFKVISNDLNKYVISLYKEILSGGKMLELYKYDWISREMFNDVRDNPQNYHEWYVGYVLNVWSFGCNQKDYLYAKDLEEFKYALHQAIVHDDFGLMKKNPLFDGLEIPEDIRKIDYKKHPLKRIAFMGKIKQFIKDCKDDPRLINLERLEQMENITQMEHLSAIKRHHIYTDKLTLFSMDYKELYDFIPDDIKEKAVFYCLPEGSLIYQNGSYLPIEDVIENETNLGNGNICFKKHKRYTENEELIVLNVMGLSKYNKIKLSKNHIVFVYDKEKDLIIEKKAEEITKKDLLLIDYEKEVNNFFPTYKQYSKFSKRIPQINMKYIKDFAELLGMFMAQGHLQNGIVLSYNENKTELHFRAKEIFNNFFNLDAIIAEHSPHYSVTQIRNNSVELEMFFREFYNGENAKKKKLKDFVMLWDKELQLSLLKGWITSDGMLEVSSQNRQKIIGTSSSFELITQMYNIALRCGLHPSIKTRISKRKKPLKNGDMSTTTYDLYFSNIDVEIILGKTIDGRKLTQRFHKNGYLITRINSIEKEKFTGYMYDLTTTYGRFWTSFNVMCHNCDPPYENTKQYLFGADFDYKAFWEWFRNCPYSVYVSSYNAPDDIKPINYDYKQVNLDNGNKNDGRYAEKKKAVENIYWNGKGNPEPTLLDMLFNV